VAVAAEALAAAARIGAVVAAVKIGAVVEAAAVDGATGGGMAGAVVMLPAAGDMIVGVIGEISATLARTDPGMLTLPPAAGLHENAAGSVGAPT
jgi:hypothetical protein